MALTFGGATSDKVVTAAYATANTAFTVWAWIYPTTLGSNRRIFTHGPANSDEIFFLSGTTGNFSLFVTRATTNMSFISNTTPLSTLNKWYFVAGVYNESGGAGHNGALYVGDLTTILSETTYGTATDGVGSRTGGTGVGVLTIGNNPSAPVLSFQGRIATAGYVARALSIGELKSIQYRPRVVANQVGYWILGANGTSTQPDWSGNGLPGTVTGATVVDHVPLAPPFAYSTMPPYVVAAAGGATVNQYFMMLGCGS